MKVLHFFPNLTYELIPEIVVPKMQTI